MSITYILVANAKQASLYAIPKAKLYNGSASLSLISEQKHPENRERNQALVSDKAGRHRSHRAGHGTMVEMSDPHDKQIEQFAKSLAMDLDQAYLASDFDQLIIAAPPRFHGMINKHLPGRLGHAVSANIEKDYTQLAENDLIQLLQAYV